MPRSRIDQARALAGAMAPLFVLGMISVVHGQVGQSRQSREEGNPTSLELPADLSILRRDD